MTSLSLEWRRGTQRDSDAINELYKVVTGRARNLTEYRWQWFEAPGGPGEIWLIEATENGTRNIVGHHGVMPIRFSNGSSNLLAGKTENTMVHPDYRQRLLYPRFERRFLGEYAPRFDALFSTTGPAAALRQRQRLGYIDAAQWRRYAWALGPAALPVFAARNRPSTRIPLDEIAAAASRLPNRRTWFRKRGAKRTRLLAEDAARNDGFFDLFWDNARRDVGITPQRWSQDLDWRFWSNPNGTYTTLVFEWSDFAGFAIVRKAGKHIIQIADVVVTPSRPETISLALEATLDWGVDIGAQLAYFSTTSDFTEMTAALDAVSYRDLSLLAQQLRHGGKPDPSASPSIGMLRHVTKRGLSQDVSASGWQVTPLVFEGRR